jgi:flagellar hook-length control protein FliK
VQAQAIPLPVAHQTPEAQTSVVPLGDSDLTAPTPVPDRAPASPQAPEASAFADAVRADAPPPPSATQPAAVQPALATPAQGLASGSPAPAPHAHPTINAQPGHFGHQMGVEIARTAHTGSEELTVRLNPIELGRIEVKLSFDDRGTVRAVVAAENPAALDMLRRDSADLNRALADAGIRSDAQSFRFDTRAGSGGEGGQFWQRQQQASQQNGRSYPNTSPASEDPVYRPLRTSGQVDLMA